MLQKVYTLYWPINKTSGIKISARKENKLYWIISPTCALIMCSSLRGSFLPADGLSNSWTWSEFMAVHPSWWHSVTTWCWSENLNSYTLSPAVLTLCAESDLWQAAVSSDGRRAHVMCLIYCIALYLLQAIEAEEPGRRTGRWNREEGVKVANLLGEKSLIKTSTSEGRV